MDEVKFLTHFILLVVDPVFDPTLRSMKPGNMIKSHIHKVEHSAFTSLLHWCTLLYFCVLISCSFVLCY